MLPPYLALSINRRKYGTKVSKWNYQRTNLPLKSSPRGNTYCYMCASCQASWLCANYIIQDIMFWDWWTTRTIKEGWPWLLCDLTETVVYFLFLLPVIVFVLLVWALVVFWNFNKISFVLVKTTVILNLVINHNWVYRDLSHYFIVFSTE